MALLRLRRTLFRTRADDLPDPDTPVKPPAALSDVDVHLLQVVLLRPAHPHKPTGADPLASGVPLLSPT
ncbi:MAG TPA: hypothetical protein VF584_21710 [Longimicrobium sp.]|jgi:hypothetical protein